ncbi:MAG: LacI family DNA-binding transcriptional regulator [Fidelibacterota bacterium]
MIKSTSIRDVANACGVAISTVSKALNNKPGVSSETRELILKTAKKFHYIPDAYARGLVQGKTDTIGFLIDRTHSNLFSNPFYSLILDGVDNELGKQGYNLLISSHSDYHHKRSLPRMIQEKRVDGVIIVGKVHERIIDELLRMDFPFVLVDNIYKSAKVKCVVTDNINGAIQAVNHLVKLGHTRIGMLKGENGDISLKERYEGYLQALKSNSLNIYREYIIPGFNTPEGGYEAMQKLLISKEVPTAIFTSNDAMAIGALKAMREKGLRVPQDISIIGFDDIRESAHTHPPLSSIRIEKEKMGKIGAKILIDIIKSKGGGKEIIVLKTNLVPRQSTAPPSKP